MTQDFRLSYGLGLALKLGGVARIELNYCVPVKVGTFKILTILSILGKFRLPEGTDQPQACSLELELTSSSVFPLVISSSIETRSS